MAEETPPQLLPEEAIAFFRAKGIAFGFDWRDVWQEEHAKAFTVAKAMSRDLIEDIRAAVDDAITKGTTLATFRAELTPLLMARGWWGRSLETDPLTGEQRVVQLGSPARLRTIFSMNLRSAYQAGRWDRIQRQKKLFPFLIYESVKDGRERAEHGAWHKTALPVDDPWWDTHYPPCDWECRCTARPVNQRMLDRRGEAVTLEPVRFPQRDYVNRRTGEITRIERGIGPGFSFNVGKAYLDPLAPGPMASAPGEDDAIAATDLSADAERALKALLKPFDVDAGKLQRGTIWRDETGWPIAVGAGLFRNARGALALPVGKRRNVVQAGLQALADPDEIRLVWVRDQSGRAMMLRRYLRGRVAIDVGRAGWRTAQLRSAGGGKIIWGRERGEIAAYNPRQPRDGKGQFASTGSRLLGFASATGDPSEAFDLGVADGRGLKDTAGYSRSISRQVATEVMNKHGAGGKRADKHPVELNDLAKIPGIVQNGRVFPMGQARGGKGLRLRHEQVIDGINHVYIERVGRKRKQLTGATFYKQD